MIDRVPSIALSLLLLAGCNSEPTTPREEAEQAQAELEDAREEAAELIAESEEEAVDIVGDANEQATNEVRQAEQEADELVREAKQELQQKLEKLGDPEAIVAPENVDPTILEPEDSVLESEPEASNL